MAIQINLDDLSLEEIGILGDELGLDPLTADLSAWKPATFGAATRLAGVHRWLILRRTHPELTLDQVMRLPTSELERMGAADPTPAGEPGTPPSSATSPSSRTTSASRRRSSGV